MAYRVFLVEDEVVTREGIRDNVDWTGHGFEFCGEAPDGEMALPLLQATRPDVLITDIRMPFLDGLQLSRIVRDRMPATKIVILSGHDEFEYAQKAIQIGISEYLLKPISVRDLHGMLRKVGAELDRERAEQQALQRLRDQIEESRAALRERFLLKLVTGAASSAEAIEKSQLLGIDLVARCYLIAILRIEPLDPAEPLDYARTQQVHQVIAGQVERNPDVFVLRKDVDELVLVMKGSSPENLQEEKDLLLSQVGGQVESLHARLVAGVGASRKRIGDICQSFLEAADSLDKLPAARRIGRRSEFDKADLLQVNRSAIEDYLRVGSVEGFDRFLEEFLRPLGGPALQSPAVNHYIFMDLVLASARFVDELGGDPAQVVPEFNDIEAVLAGIETGEQLQEQARRVLVGALVYRDGRAGSSYDALIRQARDFIDERYADPSLSLNDVAAQVSLSPCHFSAVFSQETGQTFKECLTEVRIRKAKELLRTTALKTFEICDRVGYNDPHYFSHVFKKQTGVTPGEFRAQA
jgi:two-component system response regulator YesN